MRRLTDKVVLDRATRAKMVKSQPIDKIKKAVDKINKFISDMESYGFDIHAHAKYNAHKKVLSIQTFVNGEDNRHPFIVDFKDL